MDKRIREAIEACRPGSEDLLAAELADASRAVNEDPQARQIADRVQAWDRSIGASLDQVDVPADLAARIMQRLALSGATAESPLASVVSAASQPAIAPDDAVELSRQTRWSRRHWLGAAALGLSAALLVLAAGFWLRQGSDLPLEVLAERWQEELGPKWESPDQVPANLPPAEAIRIQPARWQWIGRFTPTPVVAYELVHPVAGKAMLYVTEMTRAGLPGVPPLTPQWRSGGQAVGYWHSGDKVYVLVVPDERSYRAFVRGSTAPLA